MVEDLTLLRQKPLYYLKKECDVKLVQCHTYNGKIRMKKASASGHENKRVGDWITITSTENLFKLGVNSDFEKLDLKSLLFNCEFNPDANE